MPCIARQHMFHTIQLSRPIQAALLLVLVLAAYQPSLHNGFIWDDDAYVTHNLTLEGTKGLKRIWAVRGATVQYYPMVFTSFWVEYQLFGLEPGVFHLTNMTLHGINAILVWLILTRLGLPWAWLAAAVFALHPVNVESVAWISERKNVLSGLFAFWSLLILIRLYLPGTAETEERSTPPAKTRFILYVTALFLFILALLSKSVTCVLPVVFLILAWWKQKKVSLKTIHGMIPFFAAGLAAGINTSWMENTLVGASGPEWDISIVERVLIAGRALWFYAYKLIWPAESIFFYPQWEINASAWWQYLFPLAVLLLFAVLFTTRHRIGKGPVTGTAVFTAVLLPALGFINYYPMRYSFVADHFQYLAAIALIALAVTGVYRLVAKGRKRFTQGLALGLCVGLLFILSMRTWQEQAKYRNLQTLWHDCLDKDPLCWVVHNNLGVLLAAQGDEDVAGDHFKTAFSIKPDYLDAANNLIAYHRKKGAYDKAIAVLESLLSVAPHSRTTIYYNLACLYALKGDVDTSLVFLQKSVDRGFNLLSLLEKDKDLENIRQADGYRLIVEKIRMKQSAACNRVSLLQALIKAYA